MIALNCSNDGVSRIGFSRFADRRCAAGEAEMNSVAHREREKLFQAGDVQIARSGTEVVARQPHVAVTRLDLCNLRKSAGRPIVFDTAGDERLAFNRFRFLTLHRLQVAITQRVERQLALRAVYLPLLVAEVRQFAPRKCRGRSFGGCA